MDQAANEKRREESQAKFPLAKLLKKLGLVLILFLSGFLTHALVFPDILSNGILLVPQGASAINTQEQASTLRSNVTNVLFDGKHFNRTNVSLRISDYLTVKNTSNTERMWLASDTPELSTPRGYGEQEELRQRIDQQGTYLIREKSTGATLRVQVR